LEDKLHSKNGTFSQTGLSGAFHSYQDDGFHFSSVVPYDYYSVKAGPALDGTDISATVKMDIDPSNRAASMPAWFAIPARTACTWL
jgi:hypothetical protein